MSILRSKDGEVPQGAVFLTHSEVVQYQWDQIYKWEPKKEVWPFIHGINTIGLSAGFAGMVINSYYRGKLRLTKYGVLTSYVAVACSPILASMILHKQAISRRIFFEKSCPMCLEVRASLIQGAVSVIYPVILGTACNFLLAVLYATCRIPHIKEKRKLFSFWLQTTKPLVKTLSILFIAECMVVSYITQKEIKCLQSIRERLTKAQQYYEEMEDKLLLN